MLPSVPRVERFLDSDMGIPARDEARMVRNNQMILGGRETLRFGIIIHRIHRR